MAPVALGLDLLTNRGQALLREASAIATAAGREFLPGGRGESLVWSAPNTGAVGQELRRKAPSFIRAGPPLRLDRQPLPPCRGRQPGPGRQVVLNRDTDEQTGPRDRRVLRIADAVIADQDRRVEPSDKTGLDLIYADRQGREGSLARRGGFGLRRRDWLLALSLRSGTVGRSLRRGRCNPRLRKGLF